MNTLLIIAACLVLVVFLWPRKRSQLPTELGDARLVMNESPISIKHPIALHGTVDQVVELPDRSLVVIDSKTRRQQRVFSSDIAQVSLYAFMLRQLGHRVNGQGMIRVVTPGKVQFHPVSLLDDNACLGLYRRHQQISAGMIDPVCRCGRHVGMPHRKKSPKR